jgi:tetratricopeptide (TPR) repeat protein
MKTIAQYLLILISTVSLVVSTPSQNGFAHATSAENLQAKISEFNRAIRLNPKNALAYYQRGRLRYQQIDLSAAFADYNRAILLWSSGASQTHPKFADTYYNRGLIKANELKDAAGAIQDFRQALKFYKEQSRGEDMMSAENQLRYLGITID